MSKGGQRAGAGRPKGTTKAPTVVYYRRVDPDWVNILDDKIEVLKMKKQILEELDKLSQWLDNMPEDFDEFKRQTKAMDIIETQLAKIDVPGISNDILNGLWRDSWDGPNSHLIENKYNHARKYIEGLRELIAQM